MANLTVLSQDKQNRLLSSLRGNPKFKDQIDIALRRRIGQTTSKTITQFYQSAVDNVGNYIEADGGISDGQSQVGQLTLRDPSGAVRKAALPSPWQPLSEKYREYKEATGSTAGYWHFLGLVAEDYMARARGAAARPVTYTSKVTETQGKLRVGFKFSLPALPEPYDRLIRRSFLEGASGKDAEYIGPLTKGETSAARNSPSRVLLPESRRPLIVPIANRLGRLMAQYLKRNS